MERQMYYHVAPATYQPGDALWCWDELVTQGYAPAWKWGEAAEGFDGDVVCLFRTLDEAQAFVADFLPDGQLLAVDLTDADEVRVVTVAEGYPAVLRTIPAQYIRIAGAEPIG